MVHNCLHRQCGGSQGGCTHTGGCTVHTWSCTGGCTVYIVYSVHRELHRGVHRGETMTERVRGSSAALLFYYSAS